MRCDVFIRPDRRVSLALLWAFLITLGIAATPSLQAATPPVITTQPQGGTNVTATEFTFTVVATGTTPLRYQWFLNFTNRLAGATNSTLSYTNLGAFQQGFYTVVITNVAGAVTSNPALLIVLEPPEVRRQPTNQVVAVGGTAYFTVSAVGTPPLTYQWFFNVIDEIPGATNTTLILTNLQPSQSGTYQVEVSNEADTVNSIEAILLVKFPPGISSQPAGLAVPQGSPASFSVGVTGDGPFGYQWFFNETNAIFNATNATLSFANAQPANAGSYSVRITNIVGSITSAPAALNVLQPPVITQQPAGTSVVAGASATLSVTAAGSAPLHYQWFFNGTNLLANQTNAALLLPNLQAQNAGLYSVTVTNLAGAVTSSNASLVVITPPVITQQPADVSVPIGQPATFSVQAGGSLPLIYRWLFNGAAIPGANGPTYTLSSAQLASGGSYAVIVTNLAGAVTSAPAALVIQSPPVIVQQPGNRSAALGGNALFSVVAQGETPFAYQWFFNSTNEIPSATNSVLFLTNVQPGDVGRYSVVVTNRLGSAGSIEAGLTLKQLPSITQSPSSLVITQGAAAVFNVVVGGDGPFSYRWLFNGTNAVPGTNGPNLIINPAFASSAGNYSVVVTNDVGSATSAEATLTVRIPPLITQQPTNVFTTPGSSATFAASATGDPPLRFQWFFEVTNSIPGATNATLTLDGVQLVNDGRYLVRVSNDVGSASSVNATLRVRNLPTITEPPASLTVTQGQIAVFNVQTGGDGPFSYQWFFNGTNAIFDARTATLVITNVPPSAAGSYSVRVTNQVGFVISPEAALTVRLIPTITQQPANQAIAIGSNLTLNVSAIGEAPLTYQWRFQGTNTLADATNASLIISNIQLLQAGAYSVVVSNPVGVAISESATVRVLIPPAITEQPSSLVSTQGQTVTLNVVASGDAPLSYQWFFNNSNALAGASGTSLVLSNILPSAAGEYSVRITNLVGSVRSTPALVEVRPLPGILQQPASLVITQGQNASFTVVGTSDSPLSYRWRRNGSELAATNFTLTISNAQPADAAQYDVIVRNTFGAVTSAVATLTVFGIDFGDAPASYPTLSASNGARHIIVAAIRLGATIDAEPDGPASPAGDGDDNSGIDDEDGVRFVTPLRLGQPVSVEVVASTNGMLNAWLDFNRTNGWAQAGEQIFTNQTLSAGTNLLAFTVPANASVGATFARFRFSTATGLSFNGAAPDGEVEDYQLTLEPAADLQLTAISPAVTVRSGSNVTFTLQLTNAGPSTASNAVLRAQLSPRSAFVSASATAGGCEHNAGVVTCSPGDLPLNVGATFTITTTIGQGTNAMSISAVANEFDPDGASLRLSVTGTGTTPQFANSDIIIMPLPDPGIATPYPANAVVSGVTAAVNRVIVTLRNLNHDYPDDIDILLVGPGGQSVLLMSDCGLDAPIREANIVFDDDATQELPDGSGVITSGAYRLANYPPDPDFFPAPAPREPHAASLSIFRGTNPNGVWSLYVLDDSVDNGTSDVPGFIADGWTLTFVTEDPLADLAVSAEVSPALVSIGETVSTTITVTNLGPAASAAVVRHALPAGLNFVSANTAQGSCNHTGGIVTCELAVLDAGASAAISIQAIPAFGGPLTNVITVTGAQLDLNQTNNITQAVAAVRPAANLSVALSGPASSILLNQPFDSIATISNLGPNTATALRLTNQLPAGAMFVSANTSQGACTNLGATVVCALGELPSGSAAFVQIRTSAGVAGVNSNFVAVASAEPDPTPDNNTASRLINVDPAIDLALTSFASASSLPVGRDYLVVLTISNRGPTAVNALLVDTLPANATFISAASVRGACTNIGGEVQCLMDNLAAGESAVIAITTRTTGFGFITNAAVVSGSIADFNPANNSVTNVAAVVPAADLTLRMIDRPDPVWLGENVTYTLSVTNQGPNAATNVIVTNLLPPGITFISAASGQGTCARIGNEVRCELGALASGNGTVINVALRPLQAGFITNSASASSSVLDFDLSGNEVRQSTRVITATGTHANSTPVSTPLLGIANPYPSSINVSGLTSAISSVRVTLTNLFHTYADDLDVLLVGPDGRSVLLMSDCGGELSMNGSSITFDDGASNALPDGGAIFGGLFRPSNYGVELDLFPAPAPLGPYATNLSVFNGTDPNGVWSLYLVDDAEKDSGVLLNGWFLTFSTLDPMADLSAGQSVPASPVAVGSNVVFTYTVTNRGPATAPNLRLTNPLPSSLIFASATPSQGACAVIAGILECSLGNLGSNQVASVIVSATAQAAGTITNRVSVVSDGVDLRPTNNTALAMVTFELPPVITLQPVSQLSTNGGFIQFTAAATGAAPLQFQWQFNGNDLPGATTPTLSLVNVTTANAGFYRVRVSNAVGVALSEPARLSVAGPPFVSDIASPTIDEDADTGPLPFTVQDFDTPVETLTLLGFAANPALVPPGNITFGGAGPNRTVRAAPAPNASGATLVFVVVTDTTGQSATNQFTLTVRPVIDPIQILTQPRNILVVTGATARLSVSAASSLPLNYQWQQDGIDLPGAVAATLVIPNIQPTNAGSYRVLISNADTNLLSATASLQVTDNFPSPNIISITRSGTSATISFTTTAGGTYTLEYKNTFDDPEWTPLGSLTGTGNTESLTDASATISTRFYRIRAD